MITEWRVCANPRKVRWQKPSVVKKKNGKSCEKISKDENKKSIFLPLLSPKIRFFWQKCNEKGKLFPKRLIRLILL